MTFGKKFDVVLMNPPYGSKKLGDPNLHFKFVDKCKDITHKQVVIMPFRLYQTSNTKYNKIKENFNKILLTIEEVKNNVFEDTNIGNVGIYVFDINKNDNSEPKISYISNVSSRYVFSEYEKNIEKLCKTDRINFNPFRPIGKNKNENLVEFTKTYIDKRNPNNKVMLITSLANGRMNAKFISTQVGQICTNNDEFVNLMTKRKGACCVVMFFENEKSAENCKIALQNPVLRFCLYRLQDDQSMTARVYKCIPNIDWSDDRVKTDEGLLEVCGCPKDKCKEYAEYCKKIIDEVDGK